MWTHAQINQYKLINEMFGYLQNVHVFFSRTFLLRINETLKQSCSYFDLKFCGSARRQSQIRFVSCSPKNMDAMMLMSKTISLRFR